jgi:hypothetical protein
VTRDEALAVADQQLENALRQWLADTESLIRADLWLSALEDRTTARDQSPEPDTWGLITVEDALRQHEADWRAWKTAALAEIARTLDEGNLT